MEFYGAFGNFVELFGPLWNYMKFMDLYGTFRNFLELLGTLWNFMELFGTF